MELPHRNFSHISIHPNEEEWLISEADDNGYLLLYNLKTNRLQRYELPGNYRYKYAEFSPNGEMIIMIRTEILPGPMVTDCLEELKTSEIAIMNKDGTRFQVLPVPKGIIYSLRMSPNGKKIAYCTAKTIRSPGSKTFVADFDVKEYYLTEKTDQLFAGPFDFFSMRSVNYLNDKTIIIGAFAPRNLPGDIYEYSKKFNYSEIYLVDRRQSELPTPKFTENYYATTPAIDQKKNVYFIDYPETAGRSLTKISPQGKSFSWRAPSLNNYGIYSLAASPNGKYIAFIYGAGSARSTHSEFAIGMFQVDQESWKSITPPLIQEASVISVSFAS